MATNIPPHNIVETVNALIALIENPEITAEELMAHVPAPDFPTGGFDPWQRRNPAAYETGKGVIQLGAGRIIERDRKGGDERILSSPSSPTRRTKPN